MSKFTVVDEETNTSHLPPIIIHNHRKKIEAAQGPINKIQLPQREHLDLKTQLVPYEIKPPPVPKPISPLAITWSPNTLKFCLDTEPIVAKLWVWNSSARPIYIHCCGLWDESARFGASWCCYPRTRFWLPPGLKADMFVRATPHELSPVPQGKAALQIAGKHMRDRVTGYFSVPILITFLNYVMPPMAEGE